MSYFPARHDQPWSAFSVQQSRGKCCYPKLPVRAAIGCLWKPLSLPLNMKYTPSNILVSHWIHLFWGITWDVFDRDLRPAWTCLDLPGPPGRVHRPARPAQHVSRLCLAQLAALFLKARLEVQNVAVWCMLKKFWKCKKKWCTLR